MLGKLMKHEWKSVSKIGVIILLAILAVTVIGALFLSADPVVRLFAGNSIDEMNSQTMSATLMIVVSFVMYILLLVGAMYGIMIYLGVNFYRTMYTDQGYLVHTLPVTPHQILLSKTIISGLWMLLVYLALIVSMIVLGSSLVVSIAEGTEPGIGFSDIWRQLWMELEYVFTVNGEVQTSVIMYTVIMGLSLLISPFFSMIMLFGGLTLGQLSKKYKLLMSILSYIGLLIVYSIISSVIVMVTSVMSTTQTVADDYASDAMISTYGTTFIMMILGAVLLYFISHYIISKKLNMD